MNITNFSDLPLAEDRMQYYQQYLDQYYNKSFKNGQGTEEILAMLASVPRAGDWLDVGAGTTSLFWSIPLQGIQSLSVSDLYAEPLYLLQSHFRTLQQFPPCYQHVMKLYHKTDAEIFHNLDLLSHYYLFDVMQSWPAELEKQSFDLITEIGTFGLAPDQAAFQQCVHFALQHLRPGGLLLGANWVRSPQKKDIWGKVDNSFLSQTLIQELAWTEGVQIVECKTVEIEGDRWYKSVLIWGLQHSSFVK